MSTRLTYRASAKLKGYDALTDATVDAAVEEGRRRVIAARRWSWLEASDATLETAAGEDNVSLDTITDLAYIDAVRLTDATGQPVKIDYRPRSIIRDLQDRYDPFVLNTPFYWTRVEKKIVFWPTPQSAYTVTVEYAKTPGDLASDAAVDVIPDKHQDLVVWAAVVPLAFRQRELATSSSADQYLEKVLLPLHAGQDGIEQRQTSEQIRTGYWGC